MAGKAKQRASYANGERTRTALVDAAFEVFAEKGFQRLSLRQIAEAVGTSHTALLHHFGSKDALLEAVLAERERRSGPERLKLVRARGLLDAVPEVMRHNATTPGLIQLDTTLRVESLNPDHVAHAFMADQQKEFVESVYAELVEEQRAGHLRDGLDLQVIARLIAALVFGVQTAWLEDSEVDMAGQLTAFMDLIRAEPSQA